LLRRTKGVDDRNTPGHDEIGVTISFPSTPPDFPRTALRESGNPSTSAVYGFRLCASLRPE
jgi:hypothetical protein